MPLQEALAIFQPNNIPLTIETTPYLFDILSIPEILEQFYTRNELLLSFIKINLINNPQKLPDYKTI